MSKVEFESDRYYSSSNNYTKPTSKMVNFMIKLGAKDEARAQMILIGIVIMSLLLTVVIFIANKKPSFKDLPEEYLHPENLYSAN